VATQKSTQNAVAAIVFLSIDSIVPDAVCSVAELMLLWQLNCLLNWFAVAGELLEKLGSDGTPLLEGLLLRLGELCAGASDAAEEEGMDEGSNKVALAAQNALGQAIRAMGPQAVLQVLPLGLVEVRCQSQPICCFKASPFYNEGSTREKLCLVCVRYQS